MADHRRPPLLDLLVGAPGTPECDTLSQGAKQAGFPGVLADGAARIAALMSS